MSSQNNHYRVKIGDRYFDVTIKDIHARPVIATVDGVEIEVWPEDEAGRSPVVKPPAAAAPAPQKEKPAGRRTQTAGSSSRQVVSPIPGVVLSVAVKPGDQVTNGQDLLVIEAMKMKNRIRASRSGVIAAVHVTPGQTVRHKDLLVEFEASPNGHQ
ncbi:MAG: biotin/lipoyl-binding protein [Chloroflexi bacterium]|jgi:biotin carboxyl carrier protein|nr:biotin/lipoyl-binding protein [Chloroflexota bacterium]